MTTCQTSTQQLLGSATTATAVHTYDAAVRPASEAYSAAVRPASEAYDAAVRPAREAYDAAVRPAREALRAAVAGDALAEWVMADAFESYPDEALLVLGMLPATAEALHDLADREGWCGEWGRLWDAAPAAGVVPEWSR